VRIMNLFALADCPNTTRTFRGIRCHRFDIYRLFSKILKVWYPLCVRVGGYRPPYSLRAGYSPLFMLDSL
jgi:hypothetical protein